MFGRDPGNLLAASLIAREAGLTVTDAEGHDWTPQSDSFLTASPALHNMLAETLTSRPKASRELT
jgi:myo-inositol-1(or 4)-monophosphatase